MKGLSKEILQQLKERCLKEIESSNSIDDLENIKIKYFGRKGEIKLLFEELKKMPSEEKKEVGAILNEINKELRLLLENKIEKLKENSVEYQKYSILEKSLPGVSLPLGNTHPLQKIYNEIIEIFLYLGFSVEEGPEIEFEDYNFTMLNIPYDHPARDMQDTLYLDLPVSDKGKILLRTHTSPVQIRVMLSKKPPIKSIMPGRVYRHENLDASHLFNFHQVEGLAVDKGIRISDLKGVLTSFVKLMFGRDIICKFRPSYFPFTEPSLEMDIQCLVCRGKGCSVCKNTGFVEILGCGMVHPQVLYNVGLGYEDYTGFAFGLGVERVAMLKYRIDDIRLFYTNDLRFIRQF
jgi:phenylalanyl-tRNA synthetase alpha chain